MQRGRSHATIWKNMVDWMKMSEMKKTICFSLVIGKKISERKKSQVPDEEDLSGEY